MNKKRNKIAALTGAIATGKTYVSKYFKDFYGFEIVDADKIGHKILEQPDICEIIRKEFGNSVIKEGTVNRRLLGKIVFSDPGRLLTLNRIIHPLLIKNANGIISDLSQTSPVIFEAAVLIEAGWQKYFDTVLLTTCQPQIQLKRITLRDRITEKDAADIIGSQISFEERSVFADYLIDTSEGIETITALLDEIAEKLLS